MRPNPFVDADTVSGPVGYGLVVAGLAGVPTGEITGAPFSRG